MRDGGFSQFEVYWVALDPTLGAEIKKTRPCVIISPDEMNQGLRTVIVAPLTSTLRDYPMRVRVDIAGKTSHIVLDQLRTVDKQRLHKPLGRLSKKETQQVRRILQAMFA